MGWQQGYCSICIIKSNQAWMNRTLRVVASIQSHDCLLSFWTWASFQTWNSGTKWGSKSSGRKDLAKQSKVYPTTVHLLKLYVVMILQSFLKGTHVCLLGNSKFWELLGWWACRYKRPFPPVGRRGLCSAIYTPDSLRRIRLKLVSS